MKKQSVLMVILLILTISLIGVASASDDADGSLSINPDDDLIEVTSEEISSVSDLEDSVSVSSQANSLQSGAVDSNLKDDSNYQLGYNVTSAADSKLNFESADDILVITTAGLTRIDNVTTENVLNGIIDASNGYVTKNGNLITLSS